MIKKEARGLPKGMLSVPKGLVGAIPSVFSKGILGKGIPKATPVTSAIKPRMPRTSSTPQVKPPKQSFVEGFMHELTKEAKVARKGISTRGEFDHPIWGVVGALDALYRHKGKVLLGAGAGAAGAYGASKLLKKKKDEK